MDPESHKEASADLLGHPSLQISAQQSTDSERRTSRRVRKPRVVDEETKKRDDEFWKSNPLFKDCFGEEEDEAQVKEEKPIIKLDHPGKESQIQPQFEPENDPNLNLESYINAEEDAEDSEIPEEDDDFDGEIVMLEGNGEEEEGEEGDEDGDDQEGNDEEGSQQEQVELDQKMINYNKNKDTFLFFRPAFLQFDITAQERIHFSYVKLPEEHPFLEATNENEIAKQNTNKKVIGLPPRMTEEFAVDPHMPSWCDAEMFRLEDQRYNLDINIIKYKKIIKDLEEMKKIEDEEKKVKELTNLVKTNRVVKNKYEYCEAEQLDEKMDQVIQEVQHDLHNIYKKREASDQMAKNKKKYVFALALYNREMNYASEEKSYFSNSNHIDELNQNILAVPLKSLSTSTLDPENTAQELFKTYNDIFVKSSLFKLYKEDFIAEEVRQFSEQLYKMHQISPFSYFPTMVFNFPNLDYMSIAFELISFQLRSSHYLDQNYLVDKLKDFLRYVFDLDPLERAQEKSAEQQEHIPGSGVTLEKVEQLTLNRKDFGDILPDVLTQNDIKFPKISTANFQERDFKLFIPSKLDISNKISYGTNHYYLLLRILDKLYNKIWIAARFCDKLKEQGQDEADTFNKFKNLIYDHLNDRIDDSKYAYGILQLFGTSMRYLLNIRTLVTQACKALINLTNDSIGGNLLNRKEKVSEGADFDDVLEFLNEHQLNENNGSGPIQILYYRIMFDKETGKMFMSLFDNSTVPQRLAKTRQSIEQLLKDLEEPSFKSSDEQEIQPEDQINAHPRTEDPSTKRKADEEYADERESENKEYQVSKKVHTEDNS